MLFLCYPYLPVPAVTLKLSHNQDKSHPVHKAMEFFAKKSKEYSNGDITIRIYPNGTLGTQRNNGADSFWRYSPGKTNAEMEAFENSYKLFSLPYLFRIVILLSGGQREKSSLEFPRW